MVVKMLIKFIRLITVTILFFSLIVPLPTQLTNSENTVNTIKIGSTYSYNVGGANASQAWSK